MLATNVFILYCLITTEKSPVLPNLRKRKTLQSQKDYNASCRTHLFVLFRLLKFLLATTFTITLFEPYKRWAFDVENSNIKGHWIGIFTQKGEKTEIDFTEDVTAKKVLMKPFVKAYLKKATGKIC